MNAIKDAIKSGKTVVGTAGSPNVDVSLLADAGFDDEHVGVVQQRPDFRSLGGQSHFARHRHRHERSLPRQPG